MDPACNGSIRRIRNHCSVKAYTTRASHLRKGGRSVCAAARHFCFPPPTGGIMSMLACCSRGDGFDEVIMRAAAPCDERMVGNTIMPSDSFVPQLGASVPIDPWPTLTKERCRNARRTLLRTILGPKVRTAEPVHADEPNDRYPHKRPGDSPEHPTLSPEHPTRSPQNTQHAVPMNGRRHVGQARVTARARRNH